MCKIVNFFKRFVEDRWESEGLKPMPARCLSGFNLVVSDGASTASAMCLLVPRINIFKLAHRPR
jgi:hypothetical protein